MLNYELGKLDMFVSKLLDGLNYEFGKHKELNYE